MRERNGVRLGQPVRDLDGGSLGRVARLFEWGFLARRGFPILFRRDHVVRYEELRGVRGGTLVVARSRADLFDLAAGGLPPSWRIPAPAAFPSAATPSEARSVMEDVAHGRVPGATPDEAEPEGVPPSGAATEDRAPPVTGAEHVAGR